MAAIPNQKNLAKTIKSQIDNLDTIINVIVKAASSKTILLANSQLSNIKVYQTTLSTLFDKKGVVTLIAQHTAELSKLQSSKLPNYKVLSKMTKKLLGFANEIAAINIDVAKLTELKDKLTPVTDVVASITEVFTNIANMKIPGVFTTIFFKIKLGLRRIRGLKSSINSLNHLTPALTVSKVSLMLLSEFTSKISGIFTDISKTPLGILVFLKIRMISFFLRRTKHIIREVDRIGNLIARRGGLKDALILSAVFNMLESVFSSIKAIKVGIFMQIKLRRILKTIRLLDRIVRRISRLRLRPKALLVLTNLQLIFTALATLLFTAILVTPIVLLSIPAMVMLLVGIKIFAFIMRMIINTLTRLAFTQSIKGILAITLICGMLFMVAVMLLTISQIAEIVMDSIWTTVKFLLVVVLITVIIAGFGALVGLMAPFMLVAGVGLLLMLVIIGIIYLIAAALKFIQMLDLDAEKIKENVRIVIDTCREIIENIFQKEDEEIQESDKGWLSSLITYIGGGLTMIIQAVMAVAYLALMMAGVLAILLMATMLRLIQELELDVPKIEQNVELVIDTCKLIMDLVFGEKDSSTKESDKTWLESLFDYIGSGLLMIIKAVLAVAFLACALIAITMILIMAAQLRLLQELELDVPKIEQNVELVINTCFLIIRSLFDRDEERDKPSSKSFLVALIDFICPELALIIEAIFAVAFLAMSIFVILLINLLALQLRGLQEIDLNGDAISENVETVCQTAQQVINSLYDRDEQPDKPSSKSWIRRLLEFLGLDGLLTIIDAILALAWLGMTVGMINMVHLIAKQLEEVGKIQLSSSITKKVEEVCNTADKVSSIVKNRKVQSGSSDSKAMKILKWMFPKLADIVEEISKMRWVSSIMSTVGVVTQVADTLKTIDSLPNISGIYKKAEYVCDTADEIARMVTERTAVPIYEGYSRLSFLERLHDVLVDLNYVPTNGAKRAEKSIDGHLKLIEKINSIDIKKLETSAKMFEHMSDFSRSINGNFKGLAEVINKELLPLLLKIEKIFKETNSILKQTESNTANANSMIRNAGINLDIRDLRSDDIRRVVDNEMRMNPFGWHDGDRNVLENYLNTEKDNAQLLASRDICVKLEELYELLSGNGAGNAVVKTI